MISAPMETPFKIGYSNLRGWLAYWLIGTLFLKHAEFDEQARYYDFGNSSECYCLDKFLELESLAPITTVAPEATATHVARWDLYSDVECPKSEGEVKVLVEKLGLE